MTTPDYLREHLDASTPRRQAPVKRHLAAVRTFARRHAVGVMIGICLAACAAAIDDAEQPSTGQLCRYLDGDDAEPVEIVDVRPMGDTVTGAYLVSGRSFDRIVPAQDLHNCHDYR